ncbi:MAG: crotonase/enoyl-CoA hydratase family protein [Halioglobus sp.]
MEYALQDNIATISFDDGKANAVGVEFLKAINNALDKAEAEKASAVILRGREGMFSGGFDLKEFEKGIEAGMAMAKSGFELLLRLYSFPLPVVAACTGHGIAMGAFIIMASDYRIGTLGSYKISLPETRIGMELPPTLMGLTESRISPRHLTRVALLSEVYSPENAVDAGFIDEAVEYADLEAKAIEAATTMAQLPQAQFVQNKLAIRATTLETMRAGIAQMSLR